MRARAGLAVLLLLAGAVPLSAQEPASDKELERRLRACLTAGAPGAPRESLHAATVALRSLCGAQINRVRDYRLRRIDQSFGLPEATLTAAQQDVRERARAAATLQLNDEIALAVSNFTGLTR